MGTYLTRQVAVQDCTDRGRDGLGAYYNEKSESPGRWWGSGLAALGMSTNDNVTEQQMKNLFGEGRHPNAEALENGALDAGASVAEAKKASQFGRLFAIYQGNAPEFVQETAWRFRSFNAEHGEYWTAAIPAEDRARIRTELADEMFANKHGRAPLDDHERAGSLALVSRQQNPATAFTLGPRLRRRPTVYRPLLDDLLSTRDRHRSERNLIDRRELRERTFRGVRKAGQYAGWAHSSRLRKLDSASRPGGQLPRPRLVQGRTR